MDSKKVTEFKQLLTQKELLEYLSSNSLKIPTSIQANSISQILGDGDFLVHGKTGSGKTLAYLLPLIEKLKKIEESENIGSTKKAQPKAVILLPTRELALQVFSVAKGVSHFAKLRIRKLVGGDKGKSLTSLLGAKFDVLITTPERCLRIFKNKELRTNSLKFLVFDEADQLMESSFKKTVSHVTEIFRKEKLEQVILVSASKPQNFDDVTKEFFPLRDFKVLGKGEENVLNHKVSTFNSYLEEDDKLLFSKSFLFKQGKRNGLIFTGNKARAKKLGEVLKSEFKNHKIYLLHKDLEVKERVEVVDRFRKTGGVLVATDIFARGVDISHLEWVLNFDLPSSADYYLHRCGRVGRAGRSGDVFNFITSRDSKRRDRINEALSMQGRGDLRIFERKSRRK